MSVLSGPEIERLGRGPEFVRGRLKYYKTAVLAYFPGHNFVDEHAPLPTYHPESTYRLVPESSFLIPYKDAEEPVWEYMHDTVKAVKRLVEEKGGVKHGETYSKLLSWCTNLPDHPGAALACDSRLCEAWWRTLAIPDSATWLNNEYARKIRCLRLRNVVWEASNDLHALVWLDSLTGQLYDLIMWTITRAFADAAYIRLEIQQKSMIRAPPHIAYYREAVLAYFPYYTESLGPRKDLPEYQPSTTYAHVSAEFLYKTYAPQVQPDWTKICECVKQLRERVELDMRHQRQLLLYRKVSRCCTEFTDAGELGWKSLSIPDSACWLHNHFACETRCFSLRYVVKKGVDTL